MTKYYYGHWSIKVADRLENLTRLEPGWDGHQGKPVAPEFARDMLHMLGMPIFREMPEPSIVPEPDGSVTVWWHALDYDLGININSLGMGTAYKTPQNPDGFEVYWCAKDVIERVMLFLSALKSEHMPYFFGLMEGPYSLSDLQIMAVMFRAGISTDYVDHMLEYTEEPPCNTQS